MTPLVRSNRVVKRVMRKQLELFSILLIIFTATALWIFMYHNRENDFFYINISGISAMILLTLFVYRCLPCDRMINSLVGSPVQRKKSYPSLVKFLAEPTVSFTHLWSSTKSSSVSLSSSSSSSGSSGGAQTGIDEFIDLKVKGRSGSMDSAGSNESGGDDKRRISSLSIDLTSRSKYQEMCLLDADADTGG